MTTPPLPTSIDDVIDRLDRIVRLSILGGSRLGYFAALYKRVTVTIRSMLGHGYFDDDARMERLDVVFANRYIAAVDDYVDAGPRCTEPWRVAIDASQRPFPVILQHLVLGMNAHIELDLGIACAEIAPGDALPALEGDFKKINEVLSTLSPLVQEDIGTLSPLIELAERVGAPVEKPIVDSAMFVARSTAWDFAEELAPLSRAARAQAIAARAARVGRWSSEIIDPPLFAKALVAAIQAKESDDVRAVIRVLDKPEPIRFQNRTIVV